MKTIGLIGGMSWESTATYYQRINEEVKHRLGGLHSAKILLYSVDFEEIEKLQAAGEWEACGVILADIAQRLEDASAEILAICTNTMHKVVPQVQQNIHIPIVHIAQSTADVLKVASIKKVALLGTKYTMTQDFYKSILMDNGFEVMVPREEDIIRMNDIIFEELCVGILKEESKQEVVRMMQTLKDEGAQGVILGCTEIGLLIKQEDSVLPLFDTTPIHASDIVKKALQ